MDRRPSSTLWLRAFIVVVVLRFVGATGFGQWQSASIDRAASQIADRIAPRIDRLAAARVEIRTLRVLLMEDLDAREDGEQGIDPHIIEESQRTMNHAFEDYLIRPSDPTEAQEFITILTAKQKLDHDVALFQADIANGDLPSAHRRLRDVALATSDLQGAITREIEREAERAQQLAVEIRHLRTRNMILAFALDVVSTGIAIAGALALLRLIRSRAKLAANHEELQEERVAELEQFAGRVAHDILSPLGTVAFALKLASQEENPVKRKQLGDRGWAALERVKRLVDGLLDFARAGAKPGPDARASIEDTISDLVAELKPFAAESSVEVTMERGAACHVACNPGVLTSLVSNLARNAVKYIGDGPEKRIMIRWAERDDVVRVEVEDTGPGLPPDIEARLFEPYARARGTNRPGIGLGLATVKRLAEAHGGRVGVRSVPGQGCTFWFELPRVEHANEEQEHSGARRTAPASAIA